jgi:2-oxo-3-(phosphooxy)propyl 3-oxoalkanoate synthase
MPTFIHDASIENVNLNFEQTVPRSLVHKHSLENVLLTEVIAVADDRFICAGRVPGMHRFFNDVGREPSRDILFYTEMGRQASLAASHTFLGVSRGEVFIFEGSKACVTEAVWRPDFRSSESVVTEIKVQEIERRRNQAVNRVVAEHIMWIGNEQVFQGTGAWTIQPVALFQRLRRMAGQSATTPAAPAACEATRADVWRREPGENVVISTPQYDSNSVEFTSQLIVNDTHPYFFDHPCDHVPGMLLLEGCSQMSRAVVALATCSSSKTLGVSAYDINFAKFLECNIPTTLAARYDAEARVVAISISQQNVVCGTATLGIVSSI